MMRRGDDLKSDGGSGRTYAHWTNWLKHPPYTQGSPSPEFSKALGCSRRNTQAQFHFHFHRKHPTSVTRWTYAFKLDPKAHWRRREAFMFEPSRTTASFPLSFWRRCSWKSFNWEDGSSSWFEARWRRQAAKTWRVVGQVGASIRSHKIANNSQIRSPASPRSWVWGFCKCWP